MKSFIKTGIIFLCIAMIGACEEYIGSSVNCDDCFWEKPDSAKLFIYVTLNEEHPEVPIVVYRGNVEDGEVDWVDTVRTSPYDLYSAVDQYYSVSAEYRVDGKIIQAIDGDAMKAKHVAEACEFSCWVVTGGYFENELRFK